MTTRATSGAALAVIKRMFEDPIPLLMPSDTSVRQFIEKDMNNNTYSPEKWADPLLLFKWQLGEEEDIAEVMPATEVHEYTQHFSTYLRKNPSVVKPKISGFGQKLETLYKSVQDLQYDEEELECIMKSPEWPLAVILHHSFIVSNLKDEAAIVRLLVLQIMLSKPTDLMEASSLVQQIAVNMNAKKDGCTGTWSLPPPEISNFPQIGTQTYSSTLYVLAIDELLKDTQNIPSSSYVYIPVRRSWSGHSWLMAYILSFTTTSWWNHAYTLDVEYSNGVSEATEGLSMKATFMPKAATVCIPGNPEHICLVVVDATRAQFPDDWQFKVCKGISASQTGNFEFAKLAYAYLGRLSDPDVNAISLSDISQALDNMSYMFSYAELRQLQLKASILATSRFNGFGCYPNPEPPKNRKHISGPAAFNNKDEIIIGDYVLPDLAKMEEEERRTRMHDLNFWRCDPLGFFTYSTADTVGTSLRQYKLSASTNNMRILRACGVFAQDSKEGCPPWGMGITQNFLDKALGYASLMLGLTNWYLVEMGCTLFEHNYIPRTFRGQNIQNEQISEIWEKITDFIVDFECLNDEFAKNLRKLGRIMNISEPDNFEKADWINTHFSGNVPWWFVGAIAAKFGHSFKIKTPSSVFEDDIGWRIDGNNNAQYELSILTASSRYDLKVRRNLGPYFPIQTLNSTGTGLTHNIVSWDMNRLLDLKKKKGQDFSGKFVNFNGIVELNVLILPKPMGLAFVASDNRVLPYDQNTWPKVFGLNFFNGNCYLDWLGVGSE